MQAFYEHLATGATYVTRCYALTRGDGLVLGFTDHDRDLTFEGIMFRAETGLTARAVGQSTGLAVDNTEAFGGLSSEAITEADILAGRYDGAEVLAWLVNWRRPEERVLQFRGYLGEVSRAGGAFTAELRGLTELLNQPQGQVYHARCSAVLGDGRCKFDLDQPSYSTEIAAEIVDDNRVFRFADLQGFDDRWFEKGRLRVLSGSAQGLVGVVKNDRLLVEGAREVELWQTIGAAIAPGDLLRLEAGCDRRAETCRLRFDNFPNFRGFPHIPGEDWLISYPASSGTNDGGSRTSSVAP